MDLSHRMNSARRQAGLSQAQLAREVRVHRSAVSHWESSEGKRPSTDHLSAVALATGVQFEWLATGRGEMSMSTQARLASIPAARGVLIDDTIELRMMTALRASPLKTRLVLVELAEILARQRTGARGGHGPVWAGADAAIVEEGFVD